MHALFRLALTILPFSFLASSFSGNFELTNLVVSSPFQANPLSTKNSTVEFDFCDQDTPELGPVHCFVEWAVGLKPPISPKGSCQNSTFGAVVTAWHGVQNLSLELFHTYFDNSVGEAPYNVLTKFAALNLTYPQTKAYECDISAAECESCDDETMVAIVNRAIS